MDQVVFKDSVGNDIEIGDILSYYSNCRTKIGRVESLNKNKKVPTITVLSIGFMWKLNLVITPYKDTVRLLDQCTRIHPDYYTKEIWGLKNR